MKSHLKKEIAFERVLFFTDAVVAIAITLLALNLKIPVTPQHHLTFADLLSPWHQYLAFLLSFFNIAVLWRTHHDFFVYIKRINDPMMILNAWWLLFVVLLPFTTSLLSNHFGDTPAVFLYSLDIFLLSVFQNFIWDHASAQPEFMDIGKLSDHPKLVSRIHLMLNLDMINGLIAIITSFFFPKTAFFLLFFKVPLILVAAIYIGRERHIESHNHTEHN